MTGCRLRPRFEVKVSFNIFSDILERVDNAVKVDPVRFPDKSQFFRIAVMKLLMEVEKK